MIYLCDSLSEKDDEGFLKVNKKLATLLKNKNFTIVQIDNSDNPIVDVKLDANNFLISRKVKKICKNQTVIYSCAGPSYKKILKLFSLKFFARTKNLYVLFAQVSNLSKLSKMLLKIIKPKIILLSNYSKKYFNKMDVCVIKCGVDSTKFNISSLDKNVLRVKYNIPSDKKVVLHVGHMKKGRNVEVFSQIENCIKLLVTSSSTGADSDMKEKIVSNGTIVIDEYVQNIEEIYQLADCYIFLVDNYDNCIDIPLSVLEACSTGLPVIAYKFKDLEKFDNESFISLDGISLENINLALENINLEKGNLNRIIAEEYDWNKGIEKLMEYMEKGVI